MLTNEQKHIISQIVSDEESGNHLLRTPEDWEKLNIPKDIYDLYKVRINEGLNHYSLLNIFSNKYEYETFEILLYYMMCSDYDFNNNIKQFILSS